MSDIGLPTSALPIQIYAPVADALGPICAALNAEGIPCVRIETLEETASGEIVLLGFQEQSHFDQIEGMFRPFSDRRFIAVVPASLETTACAVWERGVIADYLINDRLDRLPALLRRLAVPQGDISSTIESQWESLNRVLTSIREAGDLASLFRVVTEDIGRLFGTDHAVVVRYLADLGVWRHEAEATSSLKIPKTVGFQIPDDDNPIAEKLKRKQIVTIENTDTLSDPVNQEVSEHFPGAWLLIPIVVHNEIWGSLSLLKQQNGAAWIARQMTFARIIAEHIGIAIQQAQLIERLKQDIEERHQLYLALRESENRFSQVIGSSPLPFFLKDPERRYLYVNPAFEKLTGLSLEEVAGANPAELPTAGLTRTCATDGVSDFQPVTFETRLELNDAAHDLMVTQFPLLNEEGETAALCGFLMEVTEQNNLIQALREREQQLRLLESAVENARDSILITDVAHGDYSGQRIVYTNRALREQTGYTREEILGQTPRMFQGPETSEETRIRIREAIAKWESITVEILNYRKDGTNYWAELSIVPIQREDGIFTHWVAIQRDITERRNIEQQTRNMKKMEAVGQLTSGVAHNFNNILMIISGHAQLLNRRLPEGTKEHNQVNLIRTAANRGAELVKQLMAFSRSGPNRSTVVNTNEIVRETHSMLEKVIPSNIELTLNVPPHPVFVDLDPEKLVQSLLNLAVNARDAMPEGGKLRLRLAYGTAETLLEPECDQPPFTDQTPICLIEVTDTGIGMDPATLERIFEPFFTTKEVGHGTGLGLYSVFGFVYESNGIIRVSSTPGRGTSFRMAFPVSKRMPVPKSVEGTGRETPHPGRSVLLVEDEPDTRELLEEMLNDEGLEVTLAANGEEAVRLAEQRPNGFDLLMTDWVMPRMSGRALISLLTAMFPAMPVIVMTGNLDVSLPPDFDQRRFYFLNKPFTQKDMVKTVNTALERTRQVPGRLTDLFPE
jgi:PAS domain S-box-containing protein